MRRAAKVDGNQRDIVDALRQIGCDVHVIGLPVDLLVGFRARNFLIEVKDPNGSNRLTESQKEFMATWRGQVRICRSPEEAVRLVTEAYE